MREKRTSSHALTPALSPGGVGEYGEGGKRLMKITDIKVHLPLGLLRIQTDAGIEGLSDGCGETCAEFIQQVYRSELLGQDPYHREVIWQRLMHLERLRYPPSNVYRAVVDNALWDLAGKAAGMPVWKLLGGYRDHIPCYRSGPDLETVGRVRGRCPAGAGARIQGLQGPLLAWSGSDD